MQEIQKIKVASQDSWTYILHVLEHEGHKVVIHLIVRVVIRDRKKLNDKGVQTPQVAIDRCLEIKQMVQQIGVIGGLVDLEDQQIINLDLHAHNDFILF